MVWVPSFPVARQSFTASVGNAVKKENHPPANLLATEWGLCTHPYLQLLVAEAALR